MKRYLLFSALLAALTSVQAQEKLDREECLKYAFVVSANLKELVNTPIPTDPDVKRPAGVKDEGCGAMVLPEAKLTPQLFAKLGKEVVPVGQLWMAYILPVSDGKILAADKLRLVSVTNEGNSMEVPCFALGARKDPKAGLELLLYGKNPEPLIRLPLKSTSAAQDIPIELIGERKGDRLGTLRLKFFGKYEAALDVQLSGG
jgi:hypothetical protein